VCNLLWLQKWVVIYKSILEWKKVPSSDTWLVQRSLHFEMSEMWYIHLWVEAYAIVFWQIPTVVSIGERLDWGSMRVHAYAIDVEHMSTGRCFRFTYDHKFEFSWPAKHSSQLVQSKISLHNWESYWLIRQQANCDNNHIHFLLQPVITTLWRIWKDHNTAKFSLPGIWMDSPPFTVVSQSIVCLMA
jgi:hypothetical protein